MAACLYIACRKSKFPILLIDFADYLEVNVHHLGRTFRKFVKELLAGDLPGIDLEEMINKFCENQDLELGDKESREDIATTAYRIMKHM